MMKSIRHDERGMVSITVTIILMLVISLTVLSFAQIIRREQREALDNQLSSQAYYAAESGINVVNAYIRKKSQDPTNIYFGSGKIPNKTDCKSTAGTAYSDLDTSITNGDTSVNFSCLLVNGTPDSLVRELTEGATSEVLPIKSDNGTIEKLTFSWTPSVAANPTANCPSGVSDGNDFPKTGTWNCGYGMIRLDLVPVGAGAVTRQGLMSNAFTGFFLPNTSSVPIEMQYASGSNINGGSAQQAFRQIGGCDAKTCSVTVRGLSGMPGDWYLRASTIYRSTTLTVTGKNVGGAATRFKDAQLLIDSTGKAQDVLRRVQVRVPLTNPGLHADYGIQTNQSLCKTFKAYSENGNGSDSYLHNNTTDFCN